MYLESTDVYREASKAGPFRPPAPCALRLRYSYIALYHNEYCYNYLNARENIYDAVNQRKSLNLS